MNPLMRAAFRTYGTLWPSRAAQSFERILLKPWAVKDIGGPAPSTPGLETRLPYAHGWLRLTEYGEGPTVILLHGWGGDQSSLRAFVDPLVNRGFKAVSVDLPAHGESSGATTNLIECGGALLQIMGKLGSPHGVVTHSFGGAVAAFALNHGFRADRVAMLAPPADLYELMLPVAGVMGLPMGVGEHALATFAERLDFKWEDLRVDRLIRSVEAPVLVVHDRGDRMTPFGDGEQIAKAAPNGALHTTDGLGHRQVLIDSPVIERVAGFVAT